MGSTVSRPHLKDNLVTWPGAPKLIPGAPKSIPGAPKSFSGASKTFQGLPSQELTWRGLYQVMLMMRPGVSKASNQGFQAKWPNNVLGEEGEAPLFPQENGFIVPGPHSCPLRDSTGSWLLLATLGSLWLPLAPPGCSSLLAPSGLSCN